MRPVLCRYWRLCYVLFSPASSAPARSKPLARTNVLHGAFAVLLVSRKIIGKMARTLYLVLVIVFGLCDAAQAYVGPGLGLGAIGAFIGIVTAVFLAIVGVFWFPLKKLLYRLKLLKPKPEDPQAK